MTSKLSGSIAADANVILSALIGGAANRVFAESPLSFVTTEFNVREVEEYLPLLCRKRGLPEQALFLQLKILPLRVFPEAAYLKTFKSSENVSTLRDEEDRHLGALAVQLGIPVWSNDRDFEGFPTGFYTTARLIKELDL